MVLDGVQIVGYAGEVGLSPALPPGTGCRADTDIG